MPQENNAIQYTALPNSVESEQNLLCCILRNANIQLELVSKLSESDFYAPAHAEIFAAMTRISAQNNTITFASVIDELRRNGKLAQVGDTEYVLKLQEFLPSTARYDEYLKIVKRASVMRKLIAICGDVTKMAYSSEDSDKVIAYAEEKIFELSQKGSDSGLVSLTQEASRTIVQITERYANPDKFHGINTGFRQLDRLTNGFHGGELIVLAARPGEGKSALSMNMVENIAKEGKHVAIFSLEMSNQQLIERMLSSMSGVPLSAIKSGNLERGIQDIHALTMANNVIASTMNLYGNDNPTVRPAEIRSQCRRLKSQNKLDFIVIDYIGLMQGDKADAESRQNEVASITRAMKVMAKELDVPVLALSQLKRDAEIRNVNNKNGEVSKEPVLSDLRESGAIEQDADIVMFLHWHEGKGAENVTLSVAKHRNGEQAKIPLKWIGKYVKFVNPDYMSQAPGAARVQADQGGGEVAEMPDVVMTDESQQDEGFIVDQEEN